MPTIQVPERVGYTFVGIYDEPEGGNQYYDEEMRTVKDWDGDENTTLYVQWSANTYTITFDKRGGILGTNRVEAIYDSMMPDAEPRFGRVIRLKAIMIPFMAVNNIIMPQCKALDIGT